MMRAMNRTARNIATTTKREVASRYFVKQKQVADTLKISKASKRPKTCIREVSGFT